MQKSFAQGFVVVVSAACNLLACSCVCVNPPIPSPPSRTGRTKEAPSASFLEPVLWIDST